MADILIIAQASSTMRRLAAALEEDGYSVAHAADASVALPLLYLSPCALVVAVERQRGAESAVLPHLVAADPDCLARHIYVCLNGMAPEAMLPLLRNALERVRALPVGTGPGAAVAASL